MYKLFTDEVLSLTSIFVITYNFYIESKQVPRSYLLVLVEETKDVVPFK